MTQPTRTPRPGSRRDLTCSARDCRERRRLRPALEQPQDPHPRPPQTMAGLPRPPRIPSRLPLRPRLPPRHRTPPHPHLSRSPSAELSEPSCPIRQLTSDNSAEKGVRGAAKRWLRARGDTKARCGLGSATNVGSVSAELSELVLAIASLSSDKSAERNHHTTHRPSATSATRKLGPPTAELSEVSCLIGQLSSDCEGCVLQPDGAGLRVGGCGCDSATDWLRAFGWTCPLVVAGPGPAGVTGLIRSLTAER